MNKKDIKKFTKNAKKLLIESIKDKVSSLGITEEEIVTFDFDFSDYGYFVYFIHGESIEISVEDNIKREKLVYEIEKNGLNNVIEEVAYTWFNRLIAIRFMEVNNYLPTNTRVLSSNSENKNEPDILDDALSIDLNFSSDDKDKYFTLKKESLEELWKFLFFKQCNKLSEILPGLFEKEGDYSELLFDFSYAETDGLIDQLNSLEEEDFKNQIEIIGWFYQYYNSDFKEEDSDRKSIDINKDYIYAKSQLFSTDWIVQYLVDNSLGKYWLEHNNNSSLKEKLEFYIEDQQTETSFDEISPEQIRIFDPCMGSGQILCYAFDILYEIYKKLPYTKKQIIKLILEKNLAGLDIDHRAYQLTYFNLMMKAVSKEKRILNTNLTPNVFSIQKSHLTHEMIEYLDNISPRFSQTMQYLETVYDNAEEFGSLIQIENIDLEELKQDYDDFINFLSYDLSNDEFIDEIRKEVDILKNQTEMLISKYDIVVTNPPYISRLNENYKEFIENNYNDSNNLYSAFIYRNFTFCKENGYLAMITPDAWMTLDSYEKIRQYILENKNIISLIQIGDSAYYSQVQYSLCAFIMKNTISDSLSTYIRLIDFESDINIQKQRFLDAIFTETDYTYKISNDKFKSTPSSPITYWINDSSVNNSVKETLSDFAKIKNGIRIRDKKHFIRFWFEVPYQKIRFNRDKNDSDIHGLIWNPYNNGGSFRRWYGYQKHVINWENDGEEVKNCDENSIYNTSSFFKESISWKLKTAKLISFRYYPKGFIFDSLGCTIFDYKNKEYLMGFLNSSTSQEFLNRSSSKDNYPLKSVSKLPIIINEDYANEIEKLVNENIEICKNDWDDYETSWNFKSNPLIRYKQETLKESFEAWKEHKLNDFNQLKRNEERLNEIFAEIYSINVDCTVEDNNVSITKADYRKDIKDLISYAVGCMFGRYSLDVEGLICADDNFDLENNMDKYVTFNPDKDAILPISDTVFFDNDIVELFVNFIKKVFGEDHLDENLEFITRALGDNGKTNKQKIRNYFLNDFFNDHEETYDKCPIYWQLNNEIRKDFTCFIYMHRYDPYLLAKIRNSYIEETKNSMEEDIDNLEEIQEYDKALRNVAEEKIDLDLNNGFEENFAKFQQVEIKIGKKTKKIDLLTNISK